MYCTLYCKLKDIIRFSLIHVDDLQHCVHSTTCTFYYMYMYIHVHVHVHSCTCTCTLCMYYLNIVHLNKALYYKLKVIIRFMLTICSTVYILLHVHVHKSNQILSLHILTINKLIFPYHLCYVHCTCTCTCSTFSTNKCTCTCMYMYQSVITNDVMILCYVKIHV